MIVADRPVAVADDRVTIDVLDIDSLRTAFAGADAVVHLAGVDYDFHRRAEATMRTNALGTWNALQVAAELHVQRFVLCSSVAALGLHEMRSDWAPQELPITDGHPASPVEPYSVSKAVAETMARSFADGNLLDVVCLRPCTVVTADNVDELLDPDAHIFLGEYVAATDCADAFLAALEAPAPGYGPYLVAAHDTLSDQDTLSFLSEALGRLPDTVDAQHYESNPRASAFDIAATRRALDWSPQTTLSTLRDTLAAASR